MSEIQKNLVSKKLAEFDVTAAYDTGYSEGFIQGVAYQQKLIQEALGIVIIGEQPENYNSLLN